MMATMQDFIGLFSLADDTHEDDLIMMFAVCDAMTHLDMHIPESWEFTHSPVCEGEGNTDSWPDRELWEMVQHADADTMRELRTFGWYVKGRLEARPDDEAPDHTKVPAVSRPCTRPGCDGTYRATDGPHFDADGSAMIGLTCDRECGMESVAYWKWTSA